MAASHLLSCTIELRYDSSGRLDRARSCARPNSGSTTDSASLTNSSSNMDVPSDLPQRHLHIHSRDRPRPIPALCRGGTGYTGEGYADGGEPSAEYLQAQLAIEGIWLDLEKYIKQVATAVNLPSRRSNSSTRTRPAESP